MIDRLTIERIIDTARIEDVVSQFVSLRRRGINLVGLCPFHSDRNPSFYVSPVKQVCKCFSCGEGGNAVHFIMKHEQLSYYDALRWLAQKYNIEIQERELSNEEKQLQNDRESMFILNDFARQYFCNCLNESREGQIIGLSYFRERGFSDTVIQKFQLGFCPEQRNAFSQTALKKGYKSEFLVKTGLCYQVQPSGELVDRFHGRVMFPVHTLSGKVVAFGGRILKKDEKAAKYVNSPDSEIYHKSDELYGLFLAKKAIAAANKCYLVEGYTDVISMHQAGIENVVASSGTALTQGQIRLIHRFTNNITVLYDGDAAGIKAALRGIDLLLEQGLNIKVVLLPDGEDPDSFAKKQNAESFINFINRAEIDFIRFKTRLLMKEAADDPIKKAAMVSDILDSVSRIPENITRLVYLKDCSVQLGIPEKELVREADRKRKARADRSPQTPQPQLKTESHDEQVDPEKTADKPTAPIRTPYDKIELEILYYVVRYGMAFILESEFEDEEEKAKENVEIEADATVIEFVMNQLEGMSLNNPLYNQLLNEAAELSADPDFNPAQYFNSHPKAEFSKIAAEIMTDKYLLSNFYKRDLRTRKKLKSDMDIAAVEAIVENENSETDIPLEETILSEKRNLYKTLPRIMSAWKTIFIKQKLEETQAELAIKEKEGDEQAKGNLLLYQKQLEKVQMQLAKQLGERVVLKI